MTTLDSDLLESVEKDYFDDPRVMALVNRFRCAQSEPVPVGHLVSPHGEFKPNFNFRFTFPPKSLDWSIPLYHHVPPQPAEPFSSEAISVTQTAWKMGYDACKEEKATQPSTLPPLPKNLHSLAGNIWGSICEWADAEPGAEAGEAAKQINKALDAELLAYAKEALRLNGVNV